MKFHTASDFLSQGSTHIPQGNFVACGIASSSEVDLVQVGAALRLAPRGIVECRAGDEVRSLRSPIAGGQQLVNVALTTVEQLPSAADKAGNSKPGERLVLQLYEPGDSLAPPGPRAPFTANALCKAADFVANSANNPVLALRVPFAGRRQCTFFIVPNGVVDVNIVVRGVKYFPHVNASFGTIVFDEAAQTDAWNGGAVAPVSQVGGGGAGNFLNLGRVIHVGGGGDSQETYDELQLLLWGAAQDVYCQAEAFGERIE